MRAPRGRQGEASRRGPPGLLYRLDLTRGFRLAGGLRGLERRLRLRLGAAEMALDDLDRLPLAIGDGGEHVDDARPALAIGAGELVKADRRVDVLPLEARVGGRQQPLARQRNAAELADANRVRDAVPLEQTVREVRPVRRRYELGVPDEEPHGGVEEPPLQIATSHEDFGLTRWHRCAPSSAPPYRTIRNFEALTEGCRPLQGVRATADAKAPA